MKPKCYDLFCGLGGWSEAFLAEGYECIGFDIEAHNYGTGGYPGRLILRDVRSIHGSELKDATVIVASPPCQAYSYRAMPWKRAKALPPPDNTLFGECFRIQREASEAAGHYIPLIVENVCGAQRWVGRAQWHYGSYYLWGDVPAPMPVTLRPHRKVENQANIRNGHTHTRHLTNQAEHDGIKNNGGSWFAIGGRGQKVTRQNPDGRNVVPGFRFDGSGRSFQTASVDGVKGFTPNGEPLGKNALGRKYGSKSINRKAVSAMIAKIPFRLALHIARVYYPHAVEEIA